MRIALEKKQIRMKNFHLFYLLIQLIFTPSVLAQPIQVHKPQYPETPRQDVSDQLHGYSIQDPYRWLENTDDKKVQDWIKAQDEFTRQHIEQLDIRQKIRQKMDEVAPENIYYDAPVKKGEVYFFQKSWREKDVLHAAIFRQKGLNGDPQSLIAAADFGENAGFAAYLGSGTASFQVSPKGNFLAFGIRQGYTNWLTWYIYDLKMGQLLPEAIDGIHLSAAMSWISWMPDESGFFYTAYQKSADASAPFQTTKQKLFYHQINTSQESDILMHETAENPDWQFSVKISTDNQYLLMDVYDAVQIGTYYKDLKEVNSPMIPLIRKENVRFSFLKNEGNIFYFLSTYHAPAGQIIKVDINRPQKEHWQILIPEKASASLVTAKVIGGQLLCHYTKDAIPLVQAYDFQGKLLRNIELPYIGWLRSGFIGSEDERFFSFNFQNSADPGSTFIIDIETGKSTVFFKRSDNYKHHEYITKQVFYPSKDGTMIPMFLMYKKDVKLDGMRPTWLYAYGSRWAAVPWYQIQHRIWLDMGGIYALANVRGGGEYGEEWTKAGLGLNRQTGIDDFIAAGEWLIEQRYTTDKRLAINGGSASAPLVGAALNQRPDLFGAALISYGHSDLIRYTKFGESISPNHGDPNDPEMFKVLQKWSPYHNVKNGVCYPPVFIAHGNEDILTPTISSYKLTAALQNAQGCERPILLQIAWGRGHTVGGLDERANQLAFLANVMSIDLPEIW